LVFDEEVVKITPENLEVSILINYSPDQRMMKVDNIYQYFSVKMEQLTSRVHSIAPEYPDGIERIVEYKKLQFCKLGQQSMNEIEYDRFKLKNALCIPENTTVLLKGITGNAE
jgi:hypothetical protein